MNLWIARALNLSKQYRGIAELKAREFKKQTNKQLEANKNKISKLKARERGLEKKLSKVKLNFDFALTDKQKQYELQLANAQQKLEKAKHSSGETSMLVVLIDELLVEQAKLREENDAYILKNSWLKKDKARRYFNALKMWLNKSNNTRKLCDSQDFSKL